MTQTLVRVQEVETRIRRFPQARDEQAIEGLRVSSSAREGLEGTPSVTMLSLPTHRTVNGVCFRGPFEAQALRVDGWCAIQWRAISSRRQIHTPSCAST